MNTRPSNRHLSRQFVRLQARNIPTNKPSSHRKRSTNSRCLQFRNQTPPVPILGENPKLFETPAIPFSTKFLQFPPYQCRACPLLQETKSIKKTSPSTELTAQTKIPRSVTSRIEGSSDPKKPNRTRITSQPNLYPTSQYVSTNSRLFPTSQTQNVRNTKIKIRSLKQHHISNPIASFELQAAELWIIRACSPKLSPSARTTAKRSWITIQCQTS